MKFEISREVFNSLFKYLGNRPYVEVADLIKRMNEDLEANVKEREEAAKKAEVKSASKNKKA